MGISAGAAIVAADSVLSAGIFTVALSVPAGTGAPSGTLAVGVPIVSPGLIGGGGVRRASAGVAASGVGEATVCGGFVGVPAAFAAVSAAAASVTGAAVIVDPTAVFARAVGVLSSAAVEAIGAEPAVTALAAGLGAGAPASVFVGAVGLNESRIFTAATAS